MAEEACEGGASPVQVSGIEVLNSTAEPCSANSLARRGEAGRDCILAAACAVYDLSPVRAVMGGLFLVAGPGLRPTNWAGRDGEWWGEPV
ncbi:hypothetical protein ACFU53_36315 [Streptomyces sp. NPDC057474]|uniref:hypothetical protein n=1 Tax=Streptomyces sp. NPDC057474 TaxID=3346144 RepID=UPI00369B82F5